MSAKSNIVDFIHGCIEGHNLHAGENLYAYLYKLMLEYVIGQQISQKIKSNEYYTKNSVENRNVLFALVIESALQELKEEEKLQKVNDKAWQHISDMLQDIYYIDKIWFAYHYNLTTSDVCKLKLTIPEMTVEHDNIPLSDCVGLLRRNKYRFSVAMKRFCKQIQWLYNQNIPEFIQQQSVDLILYLEDEMLSEIFEQCLYSSKDVLSESIVMLCKDLDDHYGGKTDQILFAISNVVEKVTDRYKNNALNNSNFDDATVRLNNIYNKILNMLCLGEEEFPEVFIYAEDRVKVNKDILTSTLDVLFLKLSKLPKFEKNRAIRDFLNAKKRIYLAKIGVNDIKRERVLDEAIISVLREFEQNIIKQKVTKKAKISTKLT